MGHFSLPKSRYNILHFKSFRTRLVLQQQLLKLQCLSASILTLAFLFSFSIFKCKEASRSSLFPHRSRNFFNLHYMSYLQDIKLFSLTINRKGALTASHLTLSLFNKYFLMRGSLRSTGLISDISAIRFISFT